MKLDMTTSLPIIAGPTAESCCAPAVGINASLDAEHIAAVAKAVSDPLRVQILDVLRRSEDAICQCELIALFDLNPDPPIW